MEEYIEFFGGVDTLDVTDLMEPVLVFGGRTKSASTVSISSKKLSKQKKAKKYSRQSQESIVSILGSWETDSDKKPCPSFSELESKYIAGEEERVINELASVVAVANAVGGFSESEDESPLAPLAGGIDLTEIDSQQDNVLAELDTDLTKIDGGADEYDLTALDNPESTGAAAMSLMDLD